MLYEWIMFNVNYRAADPKKSYKKGQMKNLLSFYIYEMIAVSWKQSSITKSQSFFALRFRNQTNAKGRIRFLYLKSKCKLWFCSGSIIWLNTFITIYLSGSSSRYLFFFTSIHVENCIRILFFLYFFIFNYVNFRVSTQLDSSV